MCVTSVCARPPKVGHVRKGRDASQQCTDIPAVQTKDTYPVVGPSVL